MAGTDATEGQAVWHPGGAEEDSRLREGNRHLHLAYDDDEEEEEITLRWFSGSFLHLAVRETFDMLSHVCWLLACFASQQHVSWTHLLRQVYVLPH